MDEHVFINKVTASGIVALDLFDFRPTADLVEFDIRDYLFMGLIVKEREFKAAIAQIDFRAFKGKAVAVICSTADAIIPPWVYMVLAEKLHAHAACFDFKDKAALELDLWKDKLLQADLSAYKGKKTVVRARPGIPPTLYMIATDRLKPLVKALMYGEVGMPKVIFKND